MRQPIDISSDESIDAHEINVMNSQSALESETRGNRNCFTNYWKHFSAA